VAPGKSLIPAFMKDGTVTREYLWWHHEGNRAIRMGDWKLVAAASDKQWSLYNLAEDRTESRNRVADKPAIARQLQRTWEDHWEKTQELVKQSSLE